MKSLTYTLVADGSTDQILMPILDWVLHAHHPDWAINGSWANLSQIRKPPKLLADRIRLAIELYPCDVMFVHRDAEARPTHERITEIATALRANSFRGQSVAVVPIRMSEAWLLFDEQAIRTAAGRRASRVSLTLPPLKKLESLPDPKQNLLDLLRAASGLTGRKADKFYPHERIKRVAELIDDYSPLRALSAFQTLESAVKALPLT